MIEINEPIYSVYMGNNAGLIKNVAERIGLYTKDLFILVNEKKPKPFYKQQHARKIHSYLWVFQVE